MNLSGKWNLPPEDRFFARVDKTESCWLWTGSRGDGRYGKFMVDGRTVMAHRWSYEFHVEPIPEGLQIDHICGVHNCVNPDHLRVVTGSVNVLAYHREQKRYCRNGHDITVPDSTVFRLGGTVRLCRQCERDRKNAYRRKRSSKG